MAFGPSRKRKMIKPRRRFARKVRKVSTSIKRYVAKALSRNTETKYVQNSVTGVNVGSGSAQVVPSRAYFVNPSLGTGEGARIGDEIMMTGWRLRMLFGFNFTNSVTGGQVRLIIGYLPTGVSGATVVDVESALFTNATNGVDLTMAIRDKDAPVKVLYDRCFKAPNIPLATVAGGTQTRFFDFNKYVSLKKLKLKWNDAGSVPIRNQLFLYMVSNGSGTTTGDVTCTFNARAYYKDA